MTPRKFVPLAVLCGTIAITGWGATRLGVVGSSGIDHDASNREAIHGATPFSGETQRAAGAPFLSAMNSAAVAATSDLDLPEPAVTVGKAVMADPHPPENASVPEAALPVA